MQDMLANRYLLDGQAARAADLYRQALAEQPGSPSLQCRLILAQLDLQQVDEAARLVVGELRAEGVAGLLRLAHGCEGFETAGQGAQIPAVDGLRALLVGQLEEARRWLRMVDPNEHPAVAGLLAMLETDHAP